MTMATTRDIVYDIVFIHGLADFSKSWRRLRDLLAPHGFVIHFFDYETFNNRLDIPRFARLLKEYISLAVGDMPYQIVAHSQGGLIAEWYDAFEREEQRLRRITTIATPFQGNALPLIPSKDLIDHLFFSKRQIEDLSSFSPVMQRLVNHRFHPETSRTEFVLFIGNVGRILKIESDMVVAVCEANRNAIYYKKKDHAYEKITVPHNPFIILDKSHLPFSYLKHLNENDDRFAGRLLDLLEEKALEVSGNEHLSQGALLLPENLEKTLKLPATMEKIISRTTLDGKFQLIFIEIKDTKNNFVIIDDQPIEVSPGYFTYIL